jgi:hypothetical protein
MTVKSVRLSDVIEEGYNFLKLDCVGAEQLHRALFERE